MRRAYGLRTRISAERARHVWPACPGQGKQVSRVATATALELRPPEHIAIATFRK